MRQLLNHFWQFMIDYCWILLHKVDIWSVFHIQICSVSYLHSSIIFDVYLLHFLIEWRAITLGAANSYIYINIHRMLFSLLLRCWWVSFSYETMLLRLRKSYALFWGSVIKSPHHVWFQLLNAISYMHDFWKFLLIAPKSSNL